MKDLTTETWNLLTEGKTEFLGVVTQQHFSNEFPSPSTNDSILFT